MSAVAETSLLIKDRSRKLGSIRERSLTKLAPGHMDHWKSNYWL